LDCGFRNRQSAICNLQSAICNVKEGVTVPEIASEETTPAAATLDDRQVQVQVLSTSMTIHDLSIERRSIVDYLRTIAPDKQAIALVHALEVGITEMIARRERFKH
jgi:hypothetical protein